MSTPRGQWKGRLMSYPKEAIVDFLVAWWTGPWSEPWEALDARAAVVLAKRGIKATTDTQRAKVRLRDYVRRHPQLLRGQGTREQVKRMEALHGRYAGAERRLNRLKAELERFAPSAFAGMSSAQGAGAGCEGREADV